MKASAVDSDPHSTVCVTSVPLLLPPGTLQYQTAVHDCHWTSKVDTFSMPAFLVALAVVTFNVVPAVAALCHVVLCLCCASGKVVGAAAQPVAEAAQRLQWDGDAAFELLGEGC